MTRILTFILIDFVPKWVSCVTLFITLKDGIETIIHEVTAGGNPYSLLAIIDAMTNQSRTYHNVQAVATAKSTVISLSISDLLEVCRQYPPANLRLAQMISVRVHRVTFVALHNFFGLGAELFSQVFSLATFI